jgi:hypothetical protein
MIAFFRRALLALSLASLAAALGWWWWTFFYVVGYGYLSWSEAGVCLVRDNDICALAKALCLSSHARAFITYATPAFWGAAILLSLNLWAAGTRRGPVALS